ncbi:hypothetical protein Tco_1514465 [Tanacetum coccineum]
MDFAKPVKAISLPQDVPSTSDRHLIELENQVQRLMEDHLALKSSIQTKRQESGTLSNPSKTILVTLIIHHGKVTQTLGLVSNFMASQDAILSQFEADFKQQQGEMTNKINTVLKAINDRITGALPSDTIKNLKLNVNSTYLFLSICSYPTKDTRCSSHSLNSINAIKTCSSQVSNLQKDQLQTVKEIGTSKLKEHAKTLEDEFKDLHFNLPVLEVLAHAPMYNAMLDKYMESLELGKNRSAFVQGKMPEKIKDPGLFTLPYSLGESKPFDTLANLGSCVNLILLYLFKKHKIGLLEETDHVFGLADGTKKRILATASAVIDCRKAKIAVGEGVTRSIFRVKEINLGDEEITYWTNLGKRESYTPRPGMDGIDGSILRNYTCLKGNMWESEDLIENPINWDRPPKEGDGAWHIRIELIDPDGEKFKKTFQSIPTSKKLSTKENSGKIIDLDHFHDS